MAKNREGFIATKQEHFNYSLFFLGQNLVWGLAGVVVTFLTDLGLNAALVGIVLIAPKAWDAINDTLFGYVIDRTCFKNGQKFLPWVKIGVAFVGIMTLLIFAIPKALPDTAKIIWFVIAYLLFDASYTILDAPAFALSTVMTSDVQERTAFVSGNKLWAMVGGVLATVLIPIMQKKLGWFGTALAFVVVGVAMMIPLLFTAQERHSEEQKKAEDNVSFKQLIRYLGKNKYLLVALLSLFIFGLTAVESAFSIYLARICFGDQSLGTILSACVALPVILISAIIPPLAKKIDKFYILIGGVAIAFVLSIIAYFVGYSNIPVAIAFTALKCTGLAFWQVITYMLIADTVEYGTFKSGTRAAGMTFALQAFTAKAKNALIASIVSFSLAIIGFVEGENAIQPEGVADGVWGIFTLLPAIGYLIGIVLLLTCYKLRDNSVQLMAEYNNGNMTYEEAVEKLGDKFGEPARHEQA